MCLAVQFLAGRTQSAILIHSLRPPKRRDLASRAALSSRRKQVDLTATATLRRAPRDDRNVNKLESNFTMNLRHRRRAVMTVKILKTDENLRFLKIVVKWLYLAYFLRYVLFNDFTAILALYLCILRCSSSKLDKKIS